MSCVRFLFFDSGRDGLWNHFNAAFDGKVVSKKFYICYTQQSCKSWRDGRCPSGQSIGRGVMNLNTMETCLIAAGKNLTGIVGNRDNKFHPGSTEINTITNVSNVNLGQLTKVQVEKKMEMLGDAKVKDTSRSRTTTTRIEGHDLEPMSWNAFGCELMGELLHRFKPRAVTLYCASDPLELLPMFEQKIPVIAYCYLSQLQQTLGCFNIINT